MQGGRSQCNGAKCEVREGLIYLVLQLALPIIGQLKAE